MNPARYIPNRELVAAKIPSGDAGWDAIQRFALTFDGYKHYGSFDRCADVANARRERGCSAGESLSALRGCLFFEQRRWRHYGEHPNEESMRYIGQLLDEIRLRVEQAAELLA